MKKKILIIDDDKDLVSLYTSSLAQHDYDVSSAYDGIEGIRLLRSKNQFDLVILDLKMPRMTGEKFLKLLRHDDNLKDTRVLVMSSTVANYNFGDIDGKPFNLNYKREHIAGEAETAGGKMTLIDGKIEKIPLAESKAEHQERIKREVLEKVSHALDVLTKNILIVDDDKTLVKTYAEILEPRGYNVFRAYSGLEGIKVLNRQKIDLILLDLDMSEMSGVEFLKTIRENQEFKKIKVVVISSAIYKTNEQQEKVLTETGKAVKAMEKQDNNLVVLEKKFKKVFLWHRMSFKYSDEDIKTDLLKNVSFAFETESG